MFWFHCQVTTWKKTHRAVVVGQQQQSEEEIKTTTAKHLIQQCSTGAVSPWKSQWSNTKN